MRCAPILPRDMVVITDLVCVVSVEGLLADLAVRLVVVVAGEPVVPLEPLLVRVERHLHVLEFLHLIPEQHSTVLPHFEHV